MAGEGDADVDVGDGDAEGDLREHRATRWGCFAFAEVWRGGTHVGSGATCGRHENAKGKPSQCKKQIVFGKGSNCRTGEQLIKGLKLWLLEGYRVDGKSKTARSDHVKSGNVRTLALAKVTDADLDRRRDALSGGAAASS